ncbi:MAG: hypothetical protein ACI835_000240 [Planctomycetota bacterium]|jgi:hypothetical protein
MKIARQINSSPRIALLAAFSFALLFVSQSAFAQAKKKKLKDGEMEEFEEVDPYTKGERESFRKLGYTNYAPFLWHGSELTNHVQESMGGIDILWVETEHFKIGSTLGRYKVPNDKVEKTKYKEEIARIKEKLGKVKVKWPKKEIDPWLRLHIYAQRAEDLYSEFAEEFAADPGGRMKSGPYLGCKNKFLLLICQRKSEFGRYVRTYHDLDTPYSYRTGWPDDSMLYICNLEVIKEFYVDDSDEKPFDSMLHVRIASNLTANFMDGYGGKFFYAPQWLTKAAEHYYGRKVDARWTASAGLKAGQVTEDDDYEWEERVAKLCKNNFFARTTEMFGWTRGYEMNRRDHMVIWSKLQYIVEELEGNAGAMVNSMLIPVRGMEVGIKEELLKRQTTALMAHYELAPGELDENWRKWVKKNYK